MKKLKCLWLLSFDLQNWGEQKMWQVAQRSISTVTLLSEHKLPASTSMSQRTVPREHIDTTLVQLMFILLDTGHLPSFENYTLKIPVREKN